MFHSTVSHVHQHEINDNDVILEKINTVNNRIEDLYAWGEIFIGLFVGVMVLQWFNAKQSAREQAIEEFNRTFDTQKQKINAIVEESEKELAKLKELNGALFSEDNKTEETVVTFEEVHLGPRKRRMRNKRGA